MLLLTSYFAVSFPSLKLALFRLVAHDRREDYVFMVNRAVELTANYMIGNLIVSLAAGVTAFVVFFAIGLPYALALATWVALMDLIPAIGALIGMIPFVIVASQVGAQEVLLAILFFVLYQQFENYVVAPRVMRKAVNLNPALVIVAPRSAEASPVWSAPYSPSPSPPSSKSWSRSSWSKGVCRLSETMPPRKTSSAVLAPDVWAAAPSPNHACVRMLSVVVLRRRVNQRRHPNSWNQRSVTSPSGLVRMNPRSRSIASGSVIVSGTVGISA